MEIAFPLTWRANFPCFARGRNDLPLLSPIINPAESRRSPALAETLRNRAEWLRREDEEDSSATMSSTASPPRLLADESARVANLHEI